MLLGYPIEIWIALGVAILIKIQSNKKLSILATITSVIVALSAGLLLYKPIIALLALGQNWEMIVAILIALTAENIMRSVVEISSDKDFLSGILSAVIIKKASGGEKVIIINNEETMTNKEV